MKRCKYRNPKTEVPDNGRDPFDPNPKVKSNRNPKTGVPDSRRPPIIENEGRALPFDENPNETIAEFPNPAEKNNEDDEIPLLEDDEHRPILRLEDRNIPGGNFKKSENHFLYEFLVQVDLGGLWEHTFA